MLILLIQMSIKMVTIQKYKSFFPLIYIFSAFLFVFTFGGDSGGGGGGRESGNKSSLPFTKQAKQKETEWKLISSTQLALSSNVRLA